MNPLDENANAEYVDMSKALLAIARRQAAFSETQTTSASVCALSFSALISMPKHANAQSAIPAKNVHRCALGLNPFMRVCALSTSCAR